jgi:hypothetical protein
MRAAIWARWALSLVLVGFISVQFVRADRTNPPVPQGASLLTKVPPEVGAILDRSCRDCHSNETRWPWYSHIAPMSWLVAADVHNGRDHVNFSEWTSYSADDRDKFLNGMCSLTKRQRMPLPIYLVIHRDAKLSDADVKTLCAWSDKMRDTLQ